MKIASALCAALLLAVLVQAQERCTPGLTKMENCNRCMCVPTGVWGCTRKGCLTKRDAEDVKSCVPGTTSMVRCNTCVCGDDGKLQSCTYMGCL